MMAVNDDLEVALEDAVTLLKRRQQISSDPDEFDLIDSKLPDLEAKLAFVRSTLDAGMAGQLQPPSEQAIAVMKQAAQDLDGITASNTTARAVIDIAMKALDAAASH